MIRGERFELNLDDDDDTGSQTPRLPGSFVGDVLERKSTVSRPPSAPTRKPIAGFPEHRKRNIESRFKQQKTGTSAIQNSAPSKVENAAPLARQVPSQGDSPLSWADEERIRVDQENNQRIADMSPAQIAEERRELMDSLSPSFLQKLLLRANINSGSEEQDLSKPFGDEPDTSTTAKPSRPAKSVSFAVEEPEPREVVPPNTTDQITAAQSSTAPPKAPNHEEMEDPEPATESSDLLPSDSIHFPQPSQPPSLDPASSTFLEDLHSKYFPSLPADPAKLSWMQPATAAESAAYAADAPALAAAAIRFDFTGALIPPRRAAEIPVTAGLHHHAAAPAAAGYTVAELAHLARSTLAAQRCIAFQTLGRLLFRLGRGEFGNPAAENLVVQQPGDEAEHRPDPAAFSELAQGLWREVERCQVVPNLVEESEGRGVDGGRHVSAKAYATEAVWLWRKGGGRRWKAY